MAMFTDALRQALMPKHEYQNLREEETAWTKLQKPASVTIVSIVLLAVFISVNISLRIVFPGDGRRPFCGNVRLHPLPLAAIRGDSEVIPGAFYLTDQETADYYWMVLFIPSLILFLASAVYLLAGIVVAYSAPARHGCLRIVENNCCASKRGGVRCLSIVNVVFAIMFGLLALFLGLSLLTLGSSSSCSLPLFWCYEIACWGLVVLYGGTAFFLRKKAGVALDEGDSGGRNSGLEMLEASPVEITPEVERRVREDFKAWTGVPLFSSDEEDEAG